jgi:poly(3-hydroxybutyrate) depolymerase
MVFNSNNLYFLTELSKLQFMPIRFGIKQLHEIFSNKALPSYYSELGVKYKAFFEVLERLTHEYKGKNFNIHQLIIDNTKVEISERVILSKAFCDLVHFKKVNTKRKQQKLLIVAPLAGHHANLLSDTIVSLLEFFDVYITNWKDASMVPLSEGSFDMDDYIQYINEFIKHIGHNVNVMAVCQPVVPVLAAVSILSEEKSSYIPNSLVLIAGPVDARKNPTKVNDFALERDIEWFKNSVISIVPPNYPGFMRKVYPGFLQLAGFLSLNFEKHVLSHIKLVEDLVANDLVEARKQKQFYNRYLSVLDLPAEFYLQTIQEIFQKFSLAKGELVSRGRLINLANIERSALLCIEGERDDITGIGQTKAALELCRNVPSDHKYYHLQPGVGHYGVFSGGKFRREIVPVITNFINKYNKHDLK